jgi:branched-chain amino acid transport system substrate-binding protein
MKQNKTFSFLLLGIIGFTGLLGLSGCEYDKKVPVKIGYSMSLTGKYARTSQYQHEAYSMWAEEVNTRGGLLGRPVWLIHYDDQSDPSKSASIYEKLINKEKVDLILGPYSSTVTNAAADVTEKHRYPLIAAGAASSRIFSQGRKYVFGIYTPAKDYMDGALALAKERGLKTVALLYADSVFPISCAEGVNEKAPSYGLKIVYEGKYPRNATNLTSQLSQIKKLSPDVILSAGYLPDSLLITRQMKHLNLNPRIAAFTVGAAQPEFGTELGELAEYVYGASQWEPDPRLTFPQQEEWVVRYEKRWGREPDYHAASAWGATEIIESCVKKEVSLNREEIRDCLANSEMMTIHGLYKVDTQTGEQLGHEMLLIQWQRGRKEIVYPKKIASAAPIFPTPSWAKR